MAPAGGGTPYGFKLRQGVLLVFPVVLLGLMLRASYEHVSHSGATVTLSVGRRGLCSMHHTHSNQKRQQGTVGNVAIGRAPPQGAVDVARWGSFSVSSPPPYVEPLQPVEAYDPPVSQLPSQEEVPQSSLHHTHSLSPSHSRSTPVRTNTAHPVKRIAAKHPISSHKHSPHRKPSHASRPALNKPVARSAAHAPAAPPSAVDHQSHEEMEMDTSGTGGRPKSLMEAVERRQQLATCGGMPPYMMPNFTYQAKTRKATSKHFPSKAGSVGVSSLWNKMPGTKVRTENGPRKARTESTVHPRLVEGEQALVDCLENLATCGHASWEAAHALKPVRQAVLSSALGVKGRFKRCAIVGNSGNMLTKEYGEYIDAHDVVVRINVLENSRFEANLGTKADYRVLSYKMGKDVCCIQPKDKHPPDNENLTYLIWFPATPNQLASLIRKRYHNPVRVFSHEFLGSTVASFKGMRSELVRMGFGPFEDWEFITSGMHAIFSFLQSCDSLNLFGFTTDVGSSGPYWFTGRNVAPRSGRTQHAWDHERMILRLLYGSGLINICTS